MQLCKAAGFYDKPFYFKVVIDVVDLICIY